MNAHPSSVRPALKPTVLALMLAGLCGAAQAQGQSPIDVSALLVKAINSHPGLLDKITGGSTPMVTYKLVGVDDISLTSGPIVYTWQQQPSFTPLVAQTQSVSNCSDVDQAGNLTFSYATQNTTSHTFSYGFTEGIKAAFKATMPLVGETSFEASFAANQNWASTTSTSETETYGNTLPVKAAAHTRQFGQLVVSTAKLNGTFTVDVYASGNANLAIQATWPGVTTVSHAAVSLDQILPNPAERKYTLTGSVSANYSDAGTYSFTNPQALLPSDPLCQNNNSLGAAARGTPAGAAQPHLHNPPALLVHNVVVPGPLSGTHAVATIKPLLSR
jgi:Aerolysin toxin